MMPGLSEVLWDWTQAIRFEVVTTTVADYEVTETPISETLFDGVIEPIPPRKLIIKPENQRRWIWWTLWADFALSPGQIVKDPSGIQYRVMSVTNWSQANYYEYEIVQAPSVNRAPPEVPA